MHIKENFPTWFCEIECWPNQKRRTGEGDPKKKTKRKHYNTKSAHHLKYHFVWKTSPKKLIFITINRIHTGNLYQGKKYYTAESRKFELSKLWTSWKFEPAFQYIAYSEIWINWFEFPKEFWFFMMISSDDTHFESLNSMSITSAYYYKQLQQLFCILNYENSLDAIECGQLESTNQIPVKMHLYQLSLCSMIETRKFRIGIERFCTDTSNMQHSA